MESGQLSAAEVAALEEEVARAERRLAPVTASVRAATAEVAAVRDPNQFDSKALRPWWGRQASAPGDRSAMLGFACGAVTGTGISILLSFILRAVGR
jgi:hypothetical protein